MSATRVIDDHVELANIGTKSHSQIEAHIQGVGTYAFPSADGAANRILETDGAGVLTWVTKPKLDNGTAQGQMAFWDAVAEKWVNTEISELFWDDINERMGIGTDSPSYKLEVHGGSIKANNILTDLINNRTYIGENVGGTPPIGAEGILVVAVGENASFQNNQNYVTTIGYNAGSGNRGEAQTALGVLAGQDNAADAQTAIGAMAGYGNLGETQTAIGCQAGNLNQGASQSAIGYSAGEENTGDHQTAFGRETGRVNSGDYQIAMGYNTGINNSGGAQTSIGFNSGNDNIGEDQTCIGYGSGCWNLGGAQTVIGFLAGGDNTGNNQLGFGARAGQENEGDNVICFGTHAAFQNTGNDVIAIGNEAGRGNTLDNQFILQQKGINPSPLIQGDFLTGNIIIGGEVAATSARLELNSKEGALLLTRLTTVQRDAMTPVNGMVLYNSTVNETQCYENGVWRQI